MTQARKKPWAGIDANERAFHSVRNGLVGITLDGVEGAPIPEGEGRRFPPMTPEHADKLLERGRAVLTDFKSQAPAPRGKPRRWMEFKIDELGRLIAKAEAVRAGVGLKASETAHGQEWGIWSDMGQHWQHDPLTGSHRPDVPARYRTKGEAERAADRDWRALNPDRTFTVKPLRETTSRTARERPATSYEAWKRKVIERLEQDVPRPEATQIFDRYRYELGVRFRNGENPDDVALNFLSVWGDEPLREPHRVADPLGPSGPQARESRRGRTPRRVLSPRLSAQRMEAKKDESGKLSIDGIATLFGLPTYETLSEQNIDYIGDAGHYAYKQAIADGASEEEAEEADMKAQQEADTELYRQWHGGVMAAAESLFEKHGLILSPVGRKTDYPYEYKVEPEKSWKDAAGHIIETINGVGYFHFSSIDELLRSGPYTARQAVLGHLQWIKDYPAVYGDTSAERIYERSFR